MTYDKQYANYKNAADSYFKAKFNFSAVDEIFRPICYSFFPGGKRLRPVITLATADFLGLDQNKILSFAQAIEMIHVSSLIHDDLPALDNDDLRRGIPSCHKAFGEGYGVLAGDALLNLAYSECLKTCENKKDIKALLFLSEKAGPDGMLGGQALDLKEYDSITEDEFLSVYKRKTSALFESCFVVPAILAEKDEPEIKLFEKLGKNFGLMFQLLDDFSDYKAVGKGKINAVSIYGLDGTKELIMHYKMAVLNILSQLKNWSFMEELVCKIAEF